jgi:protein-S-isoprenylcysteine O-methyltransferase Ste14
MREDMEEQDKDQWRVKAAELGEMLFQWRDYTPIPLIILLMIIAEPSVQSATLGTLIVVFGELFRIYSVAFIGGVSRTRSESLGARLIQEGPFRFVRNPLYIGNFFIVLGLVVYGGVAWFAVLTLIAFAVQYYAIVHYEERLLQESFGTAYTEYCQNVPQWVPSTAALGESWDMPVDGFGAAVRSEKRTLTAIAVLLLLLMLL